MMPNFYGSSFVRRKVDSYLKEIASPKSLENTAQAFISSTSLIQTSVGLANSLHCCTTSHRSCRGQAGAVLGTSYSKLQVVREFNLLPTITCPESISLRKTFISYQFCIKTRIFHEHNYHQLRYFVSKQNKSRSIETWQSSRIDRAKYCHIRCNFSISVVFYVKVRASGV